MKQEKPKQKKGKRIRLRWNRIILAALSPVVFLAAVFLFASVQNLRPGPGKGRVGVCVTGDKMSVSWQPAFGVDACRVFRYDETEKEYILCGEYEGNQATIGGVESGRDVRLQLQAMRYIELPGIRWELPGYRRTLTVTPVELERPRLVTQADTKTRRMEITWRKTPDCSYEIYQVDESGNDNLFSETNEGMLALDFGGGTELPDRDRPLRFAVRAVQDRSDYILYSPMSEPAVIERKDMLDDQMTLRYERIGECQYELRWEESKGALYELQQWSQQRGQWAGVDIFDWNETLCCATGRLPSCMQMRYRVITYDTAAQREQETFEAEPSEVIFRTDLSALYCTVWPICELDLTEDPQGNTALGKIPAGEALCVLGEEGDRFRVRYQDVYGYVDARFCMINLPEYLGDLCEYDITNSDASIFRVHDYDIPDITDTVIKGYEHICLADQEYVAPYLYPCAGRLYQAASRVREDGYCLRIYDAFRPNEATRYLYDTVETLLDEPVPEEGEAQEDGAEADRLSPQAEAFLEGLSPEEQESVKGLTEETAAAIRILPEGLPGELRGLTPEGLSALQNLTPMAAAILHSFTLEEIYALPEQELGEGAVYRSLQPAETAILQKLTGDDIAVLQSLPEGQLAALQALPAELYTALKGLESTDAFACLEYLTEDRLTYRKVMTDRRYRLSGFLAAVTSAHNRGIALDLTLVNRSTGERLQMQSEMHDLSWYSILSRNNTNADLLARYMKEAGFRDLYTEWWHFQDDETREKIGLNTYLASGVSVEGWKKDDNGWKYRLEDGSYYRNITVTLEGKSCTFDGEGYYLESSAQPPGQDSLSER